MPTDEYGISLLRELTVCKNTIQRIRKSLQLLEQKHGKSTEVFVNELKEGRLSDRKEFQSDYDAWRSSYESLKKWEELEKEYLEAYQAMKS